jgi:hypothetical protein
MNECEQNLIVLDQNWSELNELIVGGKRLRFFQKKLLQMSLYYEPLGIYSLISNVQSHLKKTMGPNVQYSV